MSEPRWPPLFKSLAQANPGKVWGEVKVAELPGDCVNCGGLTVMSAFVVGNPPDGQHRIQAVADGELRWGYRVRMACPVCQGDFRHKELEKLSGLVNGDLEIRIDQFKPYMHKEAAHRRALELLQLAPNPYGFVCFYGPNGTGKTMLLKALVNGFRLMGIQARYTTMADLLGEVRLQYGSDAMTAAEHLIQDYKGWQVLAIDEVDRFKNTEWADEVSMRILDNRWASRGWRLTLLATNQDPYRMSGQLAYLGSRMATEAVMLGGYDVRKMERKSDS